MAGLKLLWLKSELLHPIDKGGKIRTYEMLRQLMRHHEVTYVCLASPNDPPDVFERASEYCHHLVTVPWSEPPRFSRGFYLDLLRNLFSPLPYVIEKYSSREMLRWIEGADGRGAFDVIVCDFLTPAGAVPDSTRAATVLFEHNVETVLWERTYRNARNPAAKAYFWLQYLKMRRSERRICRRFDAVAAVSAHDAETLCSLVGLDEVTAVPTGVDVEFFSPLEDRAVDGHPARQPRQPCELVFTGSMDWMPNEDAILYFAERVMPLVAAKVPQISLMVVGRNPTPPLKALAARDSRIVLTGRVDDVRPYIDRAALYVVPIRVGGGTRIKIYEAMAMGRAVVSTTIGAEGLPLAPDEEIVLADTPERFADEIVRLLGDGAARLALEQRSRRAVVERFGWDKATEAFVRAMERALARRRNAARGPAPRGTTGTATGQR